MAKIILTTLTLIILGTLLAWGFLYKTQPKIQEPIKAHIEEKVEQQITPPTVGHDKG